MNSNLNYNQPMRARHLETMNLMTEWLASPPTQRALEAQWWLQTWMLLKSPP